MLFCGDLARRRLRLNERANGHNEVSPPRLIPDSGRPTIGRMHARASRGWVGARQAAQDSQKDKL